MNRLVLAEEAERDALEAFDFYEARREGLGERFREHLGVALGKVQVSPEVAPVVYRDLRRRLVERFPYAILYRVYPGIVLIVARSCTPSKNLASGNAAQHVASLADVLVLQRTKPSVALRSPCGVRR